MTSYRLREWNSYLAALSSHPAHSQPKHVTQLEQTRPQGKEAALRQPCPGSSLSWGFVALMDALLEVASLSFLEAPPIVHVMAYMTHTWDLAGLSCMYDVSEIKHVCIWCHAVVYRLLAYLEERMGKRWHG